MTSRMRCTAIAVLFVALTGCRSFFGKPKPEPISTPDPPRPVPVKEPPAKLELPGPPPKIDTKEPDVPSAVAVIPNPPGPKPKGKRPPKKVTTATGTVQSPSPQPAGNGETATPLTNVPKLGEILTDEQVIQLRKICDEHLSRAREALAQLRGMKLSADQKQAEGRVKIFVVQAVQARDKDPQTARQLAERADLLSRDLVRTAK